MKPFKPMSLVSRSFFGNYFDGNRRFPACLTLWTVYFKTPDCGRGQYADEIDVWAKTKTEAFRIAATVIQHEYESDCRPAAVSIMRMSEFINALDAVETYAAKETV